MSKRILVTGAGSGFGKGASLALAARGHHVIASTESDEQADSLKAQAPELQVERIDITSKDIDKVEAWDLDVLINNAGAGQTEPMADVPMERVRRLFEVNVFGTLAITQKVLPAMIAQGSGRIIIVSSIGGLKCFPTFGPYNMTKHALEALGKTLRMELEPLGIDVTLINPGPYGTGFNDRMVQSMWEWFDDDSLQASSKEMFTEMHSAAVTDQMDPTEVIDKLVELTEATSTAQNNVVPADGIAVLEETTGY